MIRLLSFSEISMLLDCEARWDFRYGGTLAGTALKPRTTAPILREGRAWGAGVAAWHAEALRTDGLPLAHDAIDESLERDAEEQRELGVHDVEEHEGMATRLHAMLDHYSATVEPLPIERLEHQLVVPIPSRSGRRRSNRYRLEVHLDGIHVDDEGRQWVVEFKLRGQLTSLELIVLSRQIRLYAWAAREDLGINPVGVIVDERWNEVPKPARMVKGRGKDAPPQPSHAVDQLTTPELYRAACSEHGEEPKPETLEALAARRWHQREPVIFRPGELDETSAELVSAAQLIQDLDPGGRYPLRNPKRAHCQGCAFRGICSNPQDAELVDALFVRRPAKRDREKEEIHAVAG